MTRGRVALAGLLAVLAGGCGGSPKAAAPTVTTASTSTASTSTTVPTPTTVRASTTVKAPPLPSAAQDVAAAKRILLLAGDLPGYTPSPTSEPVGYSSAYFTCTKNMLLPGGRSPRSASQGGFILDETVVVRAAQTTSISSFAAFATSEADAKRLVTELAKPEVADCAAKTLAAAVKDLTGTAPNASTATLPTLAAGDESTGLRTTATGTTAVLQYFDLTVVRKGRALAFLFVSRLGKTPLPESERQRLVRVLAVRLT